MQSPARSIDRYLGPAGGRFFGAGFKRIGHTLTDLEIGRVDGRGRISATAGLVYPQDWSTKSTGSMRPHVSSIDGLVLSVELAEAYLVCRYGLDAEQRRRMWLRAIDIRVAAPQENLTSFDAQAVDAGRASAAAGSRCAFVSTFRCRIGTFRVTCSIEHDAGSAGSLPGRYGTADEILGDPARRHYGAGYRRREHRIANVVPAVNGELVRATVAVADPRSVPDDGFAGAYQPCVTMIDGLLSLAQLAQVLAYHIDGIERETSNTFWMRRLAMSSATPIDPLDACVDAVVTATDSKLLTIDGGLWRVLDVGGRFGAIDVRASLAHALPDTPSPLYAAA